MERNRLVDRTQPKPRNGLDSLTGVSCTSSTYCAAVGWYAPNSYTLGHTLIEAWDGTTWSIEPSPDPSNAGDILNGVSCTSPTSCMASGSKTTGRTLIESWDGTSWSVAQAKSQFCPRIDWHLVYKFPLTAWQRATQAQQLWLNLGTERLVRHARPKSGRRRRPPWDFLFQLDQVRSRGRSHPWIVDQDSCLVRFYSASNHH